MERGLLPYILEDGIPALVAPLLVLLAGVGYGFYAAHQQPPAAATPPATATAVPAAPATAGTP